LHEIAPFDWHGWLLHALQDTREGTLLSGLERGGYRLAFGEAPNAYQQCQESETRIADLTYTIGISVDHEGRLSDVLWGGRAFDLGLTIGSIIVAVSGRPFSVERLQAAVRQTANENVELVVRRGATMRTVALRAPGSLRYPGLERVNERPDRLGAILRPRRIT
jgi:predicted metalloprotease with PDZ domain